MHALKKARVVPGYNYMYMYLEVWEGMSAYTVREEVNSQMEGN